jgi:hypothetical protein
VVVLPVIKAFDIERNLGAFQMDNATNNDTALSALAATITEVNTKESRPPCFGHMVNLVVKAILYGNPQLQKDLADCGDHEAVNASAPLVPQSGCLQTTAITSRLTLLRLINASRAGFRTV